MTFNMTSMPRLHNQTGVIMPDSEKVLNLTALDKKIVKAQSEIDYLFKADAARNTHGGKRFRAKKQSIDSRIGEAQVRLEQLEKGRDMLLRAQVIEPKLEPAKMSPQPASKNGIFGSLFGFFSTK